MNSSLHPHLSSLCSVHILSGDSQGAVNHMAALAGVDAAQVRQSDGELGQTVHFSFLESWVW